MVERHQHPAGGGNPVVEVNPCRVVRPDGGDTTPRRHLGRHGCGNGAHPNGKFTPGDGQAVGADEGNAIGVGRGPLPHHVVQQHR